MNERCRRDHIQDCTECMDWDCCDNPNRQLDCVRKLRAELARVTRERDRAREYARTRRRDDWCEDNDYPCPHPCAHEKECIEITRAIADEPREEP